MKLGERSLEHFQCRLKVIGMIRRERVIYSPELHDSVIFASGLNQDSFWAVARLQGPQKEVLRLDRVMQHLIERRRYHSTECFNERREVVSLVSKKR